MIRATYNGKIIAESDEILYVEGVRYFPRESVNTDYLHVKDFNTICPWKGVATYYDIIIDNEIIETAAWSYLHPKLENLQDYVAFYSVINTKLANSENPDSVPQTANFAHKIKQSMYEVFKFAQHPAIYVGFILLVVAFVIGYALYNLQIFDDFMTNVFTEFLGILATIAILDVLAKEREKINQREELLQDLIIDAGTGFNAIARRAIDRIRELKCLVGEDGILKYCSLNGADLNGANLSNANLQGTKLEGVNFSHAVLYATNLQGVNLWNAQLNECVLMYANLENAYLDRASLTEADLTEANLANCNLWGADLTHAKLADAKFSTLSILPDGNSWHPDSDLSRFTDPNHDDYWTLPENIPIKKRLRRQMYRELETHH